MAIAPFNQREQRSFTLTARLKFCFDMDFASVLLYVATKDFTSDTEKESTYVSLKQVSYFFILFYHYYF